jgi:hypothetical protein
MISEDQYRREEIRWRILQIVQISYPSQTKEGWIWKTLGDLQLLPTISELRKELGYLREKGLVETQEIKHQLGADWMVKLTVQGVDYMEYAIPELPGIPRPAQY